MLKRIVQSLITLAAMVVAYQVYTLVAEPLLEPPLAVQESRRLTDAQRQKAEQSVTKYQRLLAAYFPPGHWSLTRPPKVIESGPVMFVLDDYKRHDDGLVELTRCALVVFPTPRVDGVVPPRDAIIIEAPQGAKLQFDDHFQPARGQIGQITRGEFPGRIAIRSDMRAPGPEDDLLIETTDLQMNTKLLYTTDEVRFRLGPNVGGGQEMEIRFLEEEGAASRSGGLKIAGVDSLELRRDVRMRFRLDTDSLLPGKEHKQSDPKAADASPEPPVEVTCAGPFHFDFLRYVASFDRDVELWQVNPDGPSDHLSCQQLDLCFAPRERAADRDEVAPLDPTRRQQKDLARLTPDRIVAQGHPVVVVSPSRGAEARGGRVQLSISDRKVTVDGGSDVMLAYGPNVLRAPLVEYQHPAADAATKIGFFRAEGPGTLRYLPDPAKPQQTLEATWQGAVKLGRNNGQPVLTLTGRPQLGVTGVGRLIADQMQVTLRELQSDAKASPVLRISSDEISAGKSPRPLDLRGLHVVPDRMAATGRVQIESPQLVGRTQELRATFRVEPADNATNDNQALPVGTPAQFTSANVAGPNQQAYQIDADRVGLQIALRGERAVPTRLACEGNVALRELPTASTTEQPIEIRGGQLTADNLDTSAHVTIVGAAPGEPAGSRLAQLQARGVTVLADAAELDQAANRLWTEGAGKATLLVSRDLEGRATATPYPLEVRWQGGLNFDGRYVVFNRKVQVEGASDWLHCDQLSAKLSAPVAFGQRVDPRALDLAELECQGHVIMDHKSQDAVGPTSHERLELERLSINQQTGAIGGDGPGVIRSTHFAEQFSSLAGPEAASSRPDPAAQLVSNSSPADNGQGPKLHFFRVDFQDSLKGNLYIRDLTLYGRVWAVYGPVDSWEQELDPNRPETLLPGTLTLKCDSVTVNEDPVAASLRRANEPYGVSGRQLGPVQLRAQGNVQIDGESPTQGMFAAQADRATYEQAKEQFVLEGTPQVPATLWHRPRTGGQMAQNSARKITYNRLSGEFKIEDIRTFDFTPPAGSSSTPQNAVGPAPLRQ